MIHLSDVRPIGTSKAVYGFAFTIKHKVSSPRPVLLEDSHNFLQTLLLICGFAVNPRSKLCTE